MSAIYLAEHDWNEVLNGEERVAYACGKCGKQLPGLIIIAKPAVAQRLRDTGRLPRGADLVESPWLPNDDVYAMDPRVSEYGCPDWWPEGNDR